MKDLGDVKHILDMSIRNRITGTLHLSHEKYIGKVFENFSLNDAKICYTTMGGHQKLSKK